MVFRKSTREIPKKVTPVPLVTMEPHPIMASDSDEEVDTDPGLREFDDAEQSTDDEVEAAPALNSQAQTQSSSSENGGTVDHLPDKKVLGIGPVVGDGSALPNASGSDSDSDLKK